MTSFVANVSPEDPGQRRQTHPETVYHSVRPPGLAPPPVQELTLERGGGDAAGRGLQTLEAEGAGKLVVVAVVGMRVKRQVDGIEREVGEVGGPYLVPHHAPW